MREASWRDRAAMERVWAGIHAAEQRRRQVAQRKGGR